MPVADCGLHQFSTHPKSEMKMADYLTYFTEQRVQAEESDGAKKFLYLKDWHLARYVAACPHLIQQYNNVMVELSCISFLPLLLTTPDT